MKQQKLTGYQPRYPRKPLRGAAMTAAALVAIGGVTGCRVPIPSGVQTEGLVPMPEPTEQELVLDGEVAIAEPTEEPVLMGKIAVTEPPEEVLVTDGEVAIPDPGEEELVLDGDVCIPEPTKNPMEQPIMPSGLPLLPTPEPSAAPEN
jgi:hypothetical protein